MNDRRWAVGIRAPHAGGRPEPSPGARAVPVCQMTSFVFEDSPDAAAKAFSDTGAVHGFVFGVAARNLSQVV